MSISGKLPSVCVFCASSLGNRPVYVAAARQLGEVLARSGITLVYGGARVGLMGTVANAVIENGGRVIGVLPSFLACKEIAHPGLTELRIVGSMHERKALMAELSTAFISLPGGIGTLEEMMEMISWNQLGVHRKPSGVLNVDGFFEPLLAQIERGVADGLLWSEHRRMILVDTSPEGLLQRLASYEPPDVSRWIRPSQT
jgi:hypothetical protein